MPSIFSLFGELRADTRGFDGSLRASEARLQATSNELTKVEGKSKALGTTSEVVARRFEKLNEAIAGQRARLLDNALAFEKGDISAKRFASVLESVNRQAASVTSRIKDMNAQVREIERTGASHFQNQIKGATSEISNVAAILTGNRLSGLTTELSGAGGALSAISGPAGLAVGSIALLGTTALGTATALFKLTESGAEFGSKIHDIAQQTGISTEGISALKYTADNAGSSIEQITTGLGRFAKTVGAAADGSKQAAAKLKDLGIEPIAAINNLDGALETVFNRIAAAKPGIDQVTLAQEAFGKSGADLIPVILQAGGSFTKAKEEAEKLGLTLSGPAADAADEFGDKWNTIKTQVEVAAAKFGIAVGEDLLPGLNSLSATLAANKDEWKVWGDKAATAMQYVGNAAQIALTDLQILDEWSSHLINTDKYYNLLDKLAVLEQKDKNFWNGTSVAAGYSGVNDQVNELTTPITQKLSRKFGGIGGNDDDGDDTPAKKAAQKAVKQIDARAARAFTGQNDDDHSPVYKAVMKALESDSAKTVAATVPYRQALVIQPETENLSDQVLKLFGFEDIHRNLSGRVYSAVRSTDSLAPLIPRGLPNASSEQDLKDAIKALTDFTKGLHSSLQHTVRIINDAPDKAKVETRPTAASTQDAYPGVDN